MAEKLIPGAGGFQENATAAQYLIPGAGSFNASGTAATLDQEGYRFRNDDGSQTTATWIANQDTNVSFAVGKQLRLRMLINATGDPASGQYQLEYKKSTDPTYTKIN